jgi:xanthine dehydrogenase accessory factor
MSKQSKSSILVTLKGGGDLGSGCAARLHRAGFRLLITELPQPRVIRRAVAFAAAVCQGEIVIEGITARLAHTAEECGALWEKGIIPVLVDPQAECIARWRPTVVVDAIMAKRNTGTNLTDAPIVIALGPGFAAGRDCHAVVETQRGHNLGRVYYAGSAAPDTGTPGQIGGQAARRVLHAPGGGVWHTMRQIGDKVSAGEVVAYVDQTPIRVEIDGVLRGLLTDGLDVSPGEKVGDVDPRGVVEHCFTISDKAWAVGGGVLEAILRIGGQHGLLGA